MTEQTQPKPTMTPQQACDEIDAVLQRIRAANVDLVAVVATFDDVGIATSVTVSGKPSDLANGLAHSLAELLRAKNLSGWAKLAIAKAVQMAGVGVAIGVPSTQGKPTCECPACSAKREATRGERVLN